MKYDGITRESLFLFADNRFRDSREFYEEHKEELKQGLTVPMRQIAAEVGSKLYPLDPMMQLIPTKMVSRIRRDTRYSKDKLLYRDNMWIMFMRDKHQWDCYPCFWFEVEQTGYSMGIGTFGSCPGLMETYRKALRERPEEYLKIVKKIEKSGAMMYGQQYKKLPAGCPDGLEKYYISKSVGFIKYFPDLDDLKDEKIINIILKEYKLYAPLYTFLLSVADEYFSTQG